MSAELGVALISAAVALLSILLSLYAAQSNLEFRARLKGEASNKSRLEQMVSRYQNPLIYAAYDLQSRIYNFVERDLTGVLRTGDEETKSYVVNSTLFLIAQYLAWAEAIRRGVQYLDLGDDERTRKLVDLLEEIRHSFSTTHNITGSPFRIARAEQRAIGELMLQGHMDEHSGSMLWRCRGYAYFCATLKRDQSFASWFDRLGGDVRKLTDDQKKARERLAALQNALIDLINLLDIKQVCIPQSPLLRIARG